VPKVLRVGWRRREEVLRVPKVPGVLRVGWRNNKLGSSTLSTR